MEPTLVALLLLLVTAWLLRPRRDSDEKSEDVVGPEGSADGQPTEEAVQWPGRAPPEGPIEIPIEDAIDLHSFPPADIPSVVEDYLEAAAGRGYSEVRLIHGRGQGVQRARVRSLLERHPLVEDFTDAPPERGGWGATTVRFRR